MNVLNSIAELATLRGPAALAIGVFDGVHLGHQEVIRGALDFTEKHNGSAAVLTFDPHPMQVLRPGAAPRLLCSTRHKLRLLAAMNVRHTLALRFDEQMSKTSAEDFVASLVRAARPLGLVSVGYAWSFGSGRTGNIHKLMDLGEKNGFGVLGVPEVRVDDVVVSSTRVREAVRVGDFALAKRLLGRDYTVLGMVIRGRQLGRELGFPTANLALENEELPPDGVYAVRVSPDDQKQIFKGAANLGTKPTIDASSVERSLEVHLLDFAGDLYDRELEISFVGRIRDERKFAGLDELKSQIARDVQAAREI
jgi:riboflavin kinase / FMN adenylyltransferase